MPGKKTKKKRRGLSATYRVQLNGRFTASDARGIVGYLGRLGASHFYSSPLLRARRGSLHCYDVVRHDELNGEICTLKELRALSRELEREGMSLLLDIVPNHMFAGDENPLWMSVLEYGPYSGHSGYFDIRWGEGPKVVVLPILGDEYERVLGSGGLRVVYERGDASFSLLLHAGGSRVPLTPRSYADVLELCREGDVKLGASSSSSSNELSRIISDLRKLPDAVGGRRREGGDVAARALALRRRLRSLCTREPSLLRAIDESLSKVNGEGGAATLERILGRQFYRLTCWRNAVREVNYRRFLNINDFVAIRVEERAVFLESHALLMELVSKGIVGGMRVDHPDGLLDPGEYFGRLAAWAGRARRRRREAGREDSRGPNPFYIVVEKILERGERLPKGWKVHGTTGYDFLNLVGGLFVLRDSAAEFDDIYSKFVGGGSEKLDFEGIGRAARREAIETSMLADLRFVGSLLDRAAAMARGLSAEAIEEALGEVATCFPVYRTYASPHRPRLTASEYRYVESAVSRARKRSAGGAEEEDGGRRKRALDFVRDSLLADGREGSLDFVLGFQQLTPAVMVKGVEDTAFYRFNRLCSLNEVGGQPQEFGVSLETFHRENALRAKDWPLSMLATSTHDTKRSEDVRARISVLSEMPAEWRSALSRWSRINRGGKTMVDGEPAPSRDDEYLIYQALLGAWPFDASDLEGFTHRIAAYALKASKEAKVRTSWVDPSREYDEALERFVRSILEPGEKNGFLADFRALEERVASFGMLNSLSQVLLKLTSPGVPDTYQGTETWDLSLVDPDNRRPVDFPKLSAMLDELEQGIKEAGSERGRKARFAMGLLSHPEDGLVKMYVLSQALAFRSSHLDVFTKGAYVPIECAGPRKAHVCAYSRAARGMNALVIAPRFFAVLGTSSWPLAEPEQVWGKTRLLLPDGKMAGVYRDVFTGEEFEATGGRGGGHPGLELKDVLAKFPVALLYQVREKKR